MIVFDKVTHKADTTLFTEHEARVFIRFLEIERERHDDERLDAINTRDYRLSDSDNKLIKKFFDSAAIRHKEDLVEIDKKANEVSKLYSIPLPKTSMFNRRLS